MSKSFVICHASHPGCSRLGGTTLPLPLSERRGLPAKRRLRFGENKLRVCAVAHVAELADAPDLGSGTVRCEGSSPFVRTKLQAKIPSTTFPETSVSRKSRP